jgi:hypothetical protein
MKKRVKDHLQSRWLFLNQKDVEGKAFKTRCFGRHGPPPKEVVSF